MDTNELRKATRKSVKAALGAMQAQASCMGWGENYEYWPEPERSRYSDALKWLEQN